MDPVSHAVLGRTLVALPRNPPGSAVIVAGMLGALSPDIDVVLMPVAWDVYLRVHEVGTHSAVGLVVCGLLTAAVVRAFARRTSYIGLAAAACAGAASHVLFDLVSGARLRIGWPVADTKVSLPAVAMADPWLIAVLVLTLVALWRRPRDQRRISAVALVGVAGFLLIKAAIGVSAFSRYREAKDRAALAVSARVVEAQWGSLRTWHVYDRTASVLRHWRVSAGRDGAVLAFSWPVDEAGPLVPRSRSLPVVQNFLRAHALGFAITTSGTNGQSVWWSDLRFCWNPGADGAPKLEPIGVSRHDGTRIACALWFGVQFDPGGEPVQQIVKSGSITQTRAVNR